LPLKIRIGVYCCRFNHPIFDNKVIDQKTASQFTMVTCQLPIRLFPFIKSPSDDIHIDRQTFVHSDILCDSFSISKQIVKNSDAIGLVPKILLTSEIECGELRELNFKHH